MTSTGLHGESKGIASAKEVSNNAFMALASLPRDADKNTLITTIDAAVTSVVSDLANHEQGDIDPDLLAKVQTSLIFLEQCLSFKDKEFTSFAKKRANELQAALANTMQRVEGKKQQKTPEENPPEEIHREEPLVPQAPSVQTSAEETSPSAPERAEPKVDSAPPTLKPKSFPYGREEEILIDYAFKRICARLYFLRGDEVIAEGNRAVEKSGLHDDGVAPFFLLSPQFPEILKPALIELIQEKRDLLSRRVYMHTHRENSDEEILRLYTEERHRDIDGIIGLAFDDWSGEIARAGIAGLPQEIRVIGPKKKESDEDGIGASLKKVFSFGAKEKKTDKKKEKTPVKETTPIRIHKEWEKLENKGVFDLSQHFSFSLLSYVLQMSEKQFETEYECISQIVNQQDTPDVGPVITNLSRLYKFYDNIFFDLVIVVLFYRRNKFDINMLQAACMSQNFVIDRLPLTMDELRRRPMEHAKHLLRCLKEGRTPEDVRQALVDYFYVHETIHASKVGKRIQASENLLKRQGEKLTDGAKKIIQEIDFILREVNNLKAKQEEDGVYLGEEIETVIEEGINTAISHIK